MKKERKMIRVEEIFQYAELMYDNFAKCMNEGNKDAADTYCDMYSTALDIMYYLGIHDQYSERCADTLD